MPTADPPQESTTEQTAWRVLLFNDQEHTFEEVIALLAVATEFDLPRCVEITQQVHVAGRAEVLRSGEAEAGQVAEILRSGGLLAAVRPA